MGCNVYANGDEIACKAGDNKVLAALPDVCLTPPPPPAGPLPIPYPNTAFSKDTKEGSKTVKIAGDEVMLKDQSYYKSSPLGNEAATNGQGAGVVSHVITGKTYFVAWSMDVKFEGENVDRHTDMTTSNHASLPGNRSVVAPSTATPATPAKCPPHSWARRKEKQPRTEEQKIKSLEKKGRKGDIGSAYNACLANKFTGQGKKVEISVNFDCTECSAQQEVDLIVDGVPKEAKAGNQAAKKRQVMNYNAISEQLLGGGKMQVLFESAANALSEAPHVAGWGGDAVHEACP